MMDLSRITAATLAQVGQLHDVVDDAVHVLLDELDQPLRCGPGCTDCCIDDVTVFEVEAAWILDGAPQFFVEPDEPTGPIGACAFLGKGGGCRIYEYRPYVCRTQGLPLRWIDEDANGELVEQRDICELNESRVELLELSAEHCWTLGPLEERLAALQAAVDAGELRRVTLRSLAEHLAGGVR